MTEAEKEREAIVAWLRKVWRGWKGPIGDDLILVVGYIALFLHIAEGNKFPAPLPVAIFVCLLVLGRIADRLDHKDTSNG